MTDLHISLLVLFCRPVTCTRIGASIGRLGALLYCSCLILETMVTQNSRAGERSKLGCARRLRTLGVRINPDAMLNSKSSHKYLAGTLTDRVFL
ncbi:hypothetical protein OH76DRAFT_1481513 [Lentinus brumalis]|uniref:Secreted protein n=1 Tax=Lentinus brumalis TaxID=2498619 RepID=A0A371DFC0_9APHY|nr:hypothetical protein OH76DRAFT_1481513 [Polyporus brumalis]